MDFEKNIFINCPIDQDFIDNLLKPTLFIIIKNGFNPRLSLEIFDSGQSRIFKIIEIIKQCKYSIHDISKVKSKQINEFARMNMPFELGIDYGLRYAGISKYESKHFLILEAEKYEYMYAISDLSGFDTKAHKNETKELFKCLYSWFSETLKINMQDPPRKIFDDFMKFNTKLLDEKLNQFHHEMIAMDYIEQITIPEYILEIKKSLSVR